MHRTARAAVVLTTLTVATAGLAGPAVAAPKTEPTSDAPAPADLLVQLTGPDALGAGLSGTWVVDLSNTGRGAAPKVRVTVELPADAEVTAVQGVDGWTCVLAPLSCELDAGLKAGEAAPALPVEITFSPAAAGRYEVAAVARQNEDTGAARLDRGAATVLVEPEPEPEPEPAPEPGPAAPGAPVHPPAQQPAGGSGGGTGDGPADAPAPHAHPAVVPAEQPAQPRAEQPAQPPAEQPVEQVPATLPFADDSDTAADTAADTADDTAVGDDSDQTALAVRSADSDGAGAGALVLGLLTFGALVAVGALAWVLMRARRERASAV